MSKAITATQLRSNVYQVLDRVLETGLPQQVKRNGETLLIISAAERRLRLSELPKRDGLNCTVEELVATSWEQEWKPDP